MISAPSLVLSGDWSLESCLCLHHALGLWTQPLEALVLLSHFICWFPLRFRHTVCVFEFKPTWNTANPPLYFLRRKGTKLMPLDPTPNMTLLGGHEPLAPATDLSLWKMWLQHLCRPPSWISAFCLVAEGRENLCVSSLIHSSRLFMTFHQKWNIGWKEPLFCERWWLPKKFCL